MDTITQLFIRACKVKDPGTRVRQVYKRFYFTSDRPEPALVNILGKICDEYQLIKPSRLIEELAPDSRWKFGITEDDDYAQACLKVLISTIRLTHRDKFPALTPPGRFKQLQDTQHAAVSH